MKQLLTTLHCMLYESEPQCALLSVLCTNIVCFDLLLTYTALPFLRTQFHYPVICDFFSLKVLLFFSPFFVETPFSFPVVRKDLVPST